MKIRIIAMAGAALATTLVLAGCSQPSMGSMPGMGTDSSASSAPATSGKHNSADVDFAQMMIPHHKQAVEMSDMLLAKDGADSRVRDLAQKIKDAQNPEITKMTGWLKQWGATVPDSSSGMSGMDHGDGMMSQADMDKLKQATGAEASKLFLEQMIQHHQGAITMAQAEVKNGKDSDAVALARSIVSAQTSEISEMQTLLSNL